MPASLPPLSSRILVRLESAEWQESNPRFRDDYRIAWITVLNSGLGRAIPHIAATYAVIGLHPDKVWPAILTRRKALLGSCEEFCGVPQSSSLPTFTLPPKKPAASERDPRWKLPRVA